MINNEKTMKIKSMKIKQLILLASILLANTPSFAVDKALIIGITRYQTPQYNLPGIDLDVAMAQKIAVLLDFKKQNTKVLTDAEASKANIKQQITQWLSQTQANDRVFIYFSGHGGHYDDANGDEADGQDEYITTYDLGNQASEGGIIFDDELAIWLDNIPAHNKTIMLDSCNSGTATRSIVPQSQNLGENVLYSKFHQFGKAQQTTKITKNTTTNKSKGEYKNSDFIDGAKHLLTLAAAQDFELAQASSKGSLFTLGFYQGLLQAAQRGINVSANELVDYSGQFIAASLAKDPDAIHTPVIFGDAELAKTPLKIVASRNSQGPNWLDLSQLAKSGKKLVATVNQTTFKAGDLIKFSVEIPTNGYLNIINVDAHDEVTIIYPNKFNPENAIKTGKIQVPGTLMPFEIEATLPAGDSLTTFVVTTKALNLYQQAQNVRDETGKFIKDFATMNESSYRSMRVRARQTPDELYTTGIKTTVE